MVPLHGFLSILKEMLAHLIEGLENLVETLMGAITAEELRERARTPGNPGMGEWDADAVEAILEATEWPLEEGGEFLIGLTALLEEVVHAIFH